MCRRDQDAGDIPGCRQPRSRDKSVLSAGDANRGPTRHLAVDPIRHAAGDLTWHAAGDLTWHAAGDLIRRPKVRAA
ncbi:MAG: hypothetical protein ACRDPY_36730 [Streptosporangiaceae bacterium]